MSADDFDEIALCAARLKGEWLVLVGFRHDLIDDHFGDRSGLWHFAGANARFAHARFAIGARFACLSVIATAANAAAIDVGFVLIFDAIGARLCNFA